MRTAVVLLVLAATMIGFSSSHALGASSDQDKIAKIVRKYAFAAPNVFVDPFKPKAICQCHDAGRRGKAGILFTTTGLDLLCVIPTSFTNGEIDIADYGCQDFDLIGK